MLLRAKNPKAWAHRGGSAENPENTDRSMAHAVELGFGYIETDVQVTKDGVVVVQHDPTLDRTWPAKGFVKDYTWEQLSQLRTADGARMMTLEELLLTYPKVRLNLDPKAPQNVSAMMEVVRLCGAENRVTCGAFEVESSALLRSYYPTLGLRTGLNYPEAIRFGLQANLGIPGRLIRGVPPMGGSAFALQVPPVWRSLKVVSNRFVNACHQRGWQVQVWTVNDADQMHQLYDLGVDVVMTDRPSVLKQVLQDRGEWEE